MKTQKANKSRLSRKTKTILYALGLVLLIPLMYVALGCPALTPEMAFRRVEKENLLGPSAILGTEDNPLNIGGHMLLAESDQACMLYSYIDGTTPNGYRFYYREKTGDATVLCPALHQSEVDKGNPIPSIVVFDDFPNAQSVRMEIETYNRADYYYSYRFVELTGQRANPDFFVIAGSTWDQYVTTSETVHFENGKVYERNVCIFTVRFYDADGALIAERTLEY